MRSLIVILTLLLFKTTLAQGVYGTLTDSATGDVIPFANILIKGTLEGKQTDENGTFSIHAWNYPVTLVFTCIGYRTKEVVVTQPNKVIKASLSPSVQMLNEVVISSAPECIQKDLALMCTDFEFYDNYMLVLAFEDVNSPARLMLLDESGANVYTLPVSKKMDGLYRDCFGRCHVTSNDSSWQVYFDYEKLQLVYPVARQTMENTFYGVDLYFAGKLFTRMYSYKNQRVDFLYAYKGNNISFHKSRRKEGENLIQTNYNLQWFLKERKKGRGYMYSTDYIQKNIDYFQANARMAARDSAALTPVQAQVVQHKNNVWIFDYTNNQAFRFDERMNKIDSVFITFHHEKGWQGTLLRDEGTDHLYTTYEVNSVLRVVRLHNHTFDPEQEWTIDNKPFPMNVRVRNNTLFFLWMDRTEYGSNRMLYKYRL
jgi:hypothetical protein